MKIETEVTCFLTVLTVFSTARYTGSSSIRQMVLEGLGPLSILCSARYI